MVEESQAGLDAVTNAISFLEDFYNPPDEKRFLQTDQKPINAAEGYERYVAENAGSDGKTVDDMAPDDGGVSGEYGGKTDAAKGILGLLEVIKSDFERSISTTTDEETAADSAYTTFKTDTETDMGDKGELKKLRPLCVETGMTWEERTA